MQNFIPERNLTPAWQVQYEDEELVAQADTGICAGKFLRVSKQGS